MSNMIVADHVGQLAPKPPASPAALRPVALAKGSGGKDFFRTLRKRFWLITVCTAVFLAISAAGTFIWLKFSPFYTAQALLQVTPRGLNPMKDDVSTNLPREVMDRLLQSAAKMVQSEELFRQVLTEPDPGFSITNTEWYRAAGSDHAIQELMEQVSVSPMATTNLIEIKMRGRDPKEMMEIVNAVAHRAEKMQQQNASASAHDMINLLRDEIKEINDRLEAVHKKMAAARPLDIPMIEDQRNSLFIRIQQTTQKMQELKAKEIEARMLVQQTGKEDLRNSIEVMQALDANAEIRSLKAFKVQLENKRADLIRQFGPKHRAVQSVESQLTEAEEQLGKLTQSVMEQMIGSIKGNREAIHQNLLEQLQVHKNELDTDEAKLKDNEKNLETLRLLGDEEKQLNESYKRVEEKLRDLRLQEKADSPLRVVRPAMKPFEPSHPRWEIMLPAGLVLGLLFGIGLAFLLEVVDTSVKSSADITRRLDLPVLGMVPHADDLEDDIADVRMAFMSNPNSLLGEAFRQIRTCLLYSGPADRRRSLLVTSPMPEDGRTTVAINLAAAMARDGWKVLVIDANFRQPAVRQLFPQAKDTGLCNVLVGQAKWQDVVCQIEPNLSVMTAGPLPPNPAELLGSQQMRQLIAELGKSYDQVIVDGAPALVVSDAPILATIVDATMLVVRAGSNTHGIVQRSWESLRRVGAHVIGVTLNGVRATAGGYLRKSYETFYEYHEQLPGK